MKIGFGSDSSRNNGFFSKKHRVVTSPVKTFLKTKVHLHKKTNPSKTHLKKKDLNKCQTYGKLIKPIKIKLRNKGKSNINIQKCSATLKKPKVTKNEDDARKKPNKMNQHIVNIYQNSKKLNENEKSIVVDMKSKHRETIKELLTLSQKKLSESELMYILFKSLG